MEKHFRRRLESWGKVLMQNMKARIPAMRKYGLWGIIFAFAVVVIQSITGDAISKLAIFLWGILQSVTTWIIEFSINHLGITVVLLSCAWIIFLITLAYFDTLQPHGLNVSKEIIKDVIGTGFLITNNSGEDLQNCKIYISQIDDEKQYRNSERDYLRWGARSLGGQVSSIDIPNTESGSVFMYQIGYKMESRIGNNKKNDGTHDLELIFNANSVSNKKITLYVYCTIMVDVIEKTENSDERLRITLLKAEA